MRAWLLGGAIAVVAATAVTAQQGRFKGRIDLVNVPVMVLDRQGNFISNLSATDFEVYENGQKQDLSVFVRGDAEREALKLRLGLLFDTSGSMFEDMGLACTAAIRLSLYLLPSRRIGWNLSPMNGSTVNQIFIPKRVMKSVRVLRWHLSRHCRNCRAVSALSFCCAM